MCMLINFAWCVSSYFIIALSVGLSLFRCFSFWIRSMSMLLQQHVKDPGHLVKNAGGRLQLKTNFTGLYILDPRKLDLRVGWLLHEHGVGTHKGNTLIGECSTTITSTRWATVDCSLAEKSGIDLKTTVWLHYPPRYLILLQWEWKRTGK